MRGEQLEFDLQAGRELRDLGMDRAASHGIVPAPPDARATRPMYGQKLKA